MPLVNYFSSVCHRGTLPRGQSLFGKLLYMSSVSETLEAELATIKQEIADIEGRLKNVAKNWELGRSGRTLSPSFRSRIL
jgi:hypothetical protein